MGGTTQSPVIRVARLVPDSLREFRVAVADVGRQFGIDERCVEEYIRNGLPSWESTRGERYLDWYDLTNVGLYHRGTRISRAMQLWARSIMQRSAHVRPVNLRLRTTRAVSWDERVRFWDPLEGFVPGRWRDGHWEHFITASEVDGLPSAVRKFGTAFAGLEIVDFVRFPPDLRNNPRRLEEAGVGDCYTSALRCVDVGRNYGHESRLCYGFLVAGPIALRHYWAEWKLDGGWTSVEPTMVRYMVGMGFLSTGWAGVSGFGPTLVRLRSDGEGVIVSDGEGNEVPFVVEIGGSSRSRV